MCLSDCSKCKYLDRYPNYSRDIVCALNPSYASMWRRLKSLDEYTLNCLPVDECQEFESDPNFAVKEISVSLSYASWQTIASEFSSIAKTMNKILYDASIDPELNLNNISIGLDLTLTLKQWQEIANSSTDPYICDILEAEGIRSPKLNFTMRS